MSGYLWTAVLLLAGSTVVAAAYAVHRALTIYRTPLVTLPALGGATPTEHAWLRYHARWYVPAMVFLAVDIEMLFMYPWAVVLEQTGVSALMEMFGFLSVVMAAVVYAWREGVFRWT